MLESRFSYIFSRQQNTQLFQGLAMDNDIMTIREVAEFLRLTEKTTYRYALEGKIPGFKIGGTWRFRKSEIDRWISEQIKRRA